MDQQPPIGLRLVVEAITKGVDRNVHAHDIELSSQNGSVGTRQRGLAMADDLHLRAAQFNAALDLVEYGIIVPRTAVNGEVAGNLFFLLGH